ncbi:MAG: flagellar biosynthesis protein FliQ [Gammaproteobacteria bacterium]|nr:flagellar biosynthesis protein FliQ [Gammaproteobacteria bacterium]
MTPEAVIAFMGQAMEVTLLLLGVVLLPALAAGLVVSLFQAATQINEITLSFIPKLLVTVLAMAIGGPWMLQLLMGFTQRLYDNIPGMIG